MLELISKIDIVSLVIGTILGSAASVWYGHFLQRPRPVINGNGSSTSRDQDYRTTHWTVTNQKRFFGVRLFPTTVLGKMIHDYRHLGLWIKTDPAENISAHLKDKRTGKHIIQLYWRVGDEYRPYVTLASGESASLMIMGIFSDQKRYFPIEIRDGSITPPSRDECYTDNREFLVSINWSDRFRPKNVTLAVDVPFRGFVTVEMKGNIGRWP